MSEWRAIAALSHDMTQLCIELDTLPSGEPR
jgi:hypothetical protein